MANLGNFLANMVLGGLKASSKRQEEERELRTHVIEKIIEGKIKQGDPESVLREIALIKAYDPTFDLSKISIGPSGKLTASLAGPKEDKKEFPTAGRTQLENIDRAIETKVSELTGFHPLLQLSGVSSGRQQVLTDLLSHRKKLVASYQQQYKNFPEDLVASSFEQSAQRLIPPGLPEDPTSEDPHPQRVKDFLTHAGAHGLVSLSK